MLLIMILLIMKEYIFYFILRFYDNQELDIFKCYFCKRNPQKTQLLWGGGHEVIISDGRKKDLKDTCLISGLILSRLS